MINIASLGSFLAFKDVAAYCASKTALLSLTRSLACEWAKDGMVNAIVPGVFPTDLNSALIIGSPRGQELLMRTPMGAFRQAGRTGGRGGAAGFRWREFHHGAGAGGGWRDSCIGR